MDKPLQAEGADRGAASLPAGSPTVQKSNRPKNNIAISKKFVPLRPTCLPRFP